MITSKKRLNVVAMVELALLTAAVLILQLAGVAIKLPFLGTPVSLVLVPIALGAMLLGPWAGAWLGFVFGMVVFVVCGVMAT
ncbi:MAG: ECF transporter S component, partial [Clostridia bacterium]|nr:ECF transporter S component [Clostridia bacterium]